ncbi:hypothetical protein EDD18DRAFT_1108879 [Armillaria luteobubalina]|uniref:Uncharacterized protein n=1 Tax=Armillaria luteobubalina TaxID=153913 RepID=A0AA39UL55_9AGAR|nr:hypothetical protein EDD18DRAFT_1108879 [Armillaria luteobubalina]
MNKGTRQTPTWAIQATSTLSGSLFVLNKILCSRVLQSISSLKDPCSCFKYHKLITWSSQKLSEKPCMVKGLVMVQDTDTMLILVLPYGFLQNANLIIKILLILGYDSFLGKISLCWRGYPFTGNTRWTQAPIPTPLYITGLAQLPVNAMVLLFWESVACGHMAKPSNLDTHGSVPGTAILAFTAKPICHTSHLLFERNPNFELWEKEMVTADLSIVACTWGTTGWYGRMLPLLMAAIGKNWLCGGMPFPEITYVIIPGAMQQAKESPITLYLKIDRVPDTMGKHECGCNMDVHRGKFLTQEAHPKPLYNIEDVPVMGEGLISGFVETKRKKMYCAQHSTYPFVKNEKNDMERIVHPACK